MAHGAFGPGVPAVASDPLTEADPVKDLDISLGRSGGIKSETGCPIISSAVHAPAAEAVVTDQPSCSSSPMAIR